MRNIIDMGAGGGNYVSLVLWKRVQSFGGIAGRRRPSRRVGTSAPFPNPAGSKAPGMEIIRSMVLPIRLPPEDRAREISVRIVRDLPYSCILGVS